MVLVVEVDEERNVAVVKGNNIKMNENGIKLRRVAKKMNEIYTTQQNLTEAEPTIGDEDEGNREFSLEADNENEQEEIHEPAPSHVDDQLEDSKHEGNLSDDDNNTNVEGTDVTFELLENTPLDFTSKYPSDPYHLVGKSITPQLIRVLLELGACQPGKNEKYDFPTKNSRSFHKDWYCKQLENGLTTNCGS